jgi:hypothetical protein
VVHYLNDELEKSIQQLSKEAKKGMLQLQKIH